MDFSKMAGLEVTPCSESSSTMRASSPVSSRPRESWSSQMLVPAAVSAASLSLTLIPRTMARIVLRMRAIQIVELGGPESLQLADIEEPSGEGVKIDVRATGVSFPEVLQSRGQYQLKPDLPFVPGSEVAGVVRHDAHGFSAGDRVAAFPMLGGFAEVALAPPHFTFKLPEALDFAQGAALILNYHTAHFALKTRGRLRAGETVLIHGAAGGVGTASIQVAKGLGAKTFAVVSSDAKEAVAREAGADEVLRSDGAWKGAAKELSGGGVDIVIDPVGGARFTDSVRSGTADGPLVVVGVA